MSSAMPLQSIILPLGPSDSCPSAPVSVISRSPIRLIVLSGSSPIDQKPTGSKDPYALRRAALGVIRLILENDLRLPLNEMFQTSYRTFSSALKIDADNVVEDLLSFFR